MLSMYAQDMSFSHKLDARSRQDTTITLLCWFVSAAERARSSGWIEACAGGKVDVLGTLQVLAYAASSFVLLAVTHSLLHSCSALILMVEDYCFKLIEEQNSTDAVRRWNVLQAFLRKASGSMEYSVLALQTCFILSFLSSLVDAVGIEGPDQARSIYLIPGTLINLGLARIFFRAAAVTDTCLRVPSLINSISFGIGEDALDQDRRYLVEYIIFSAAGFYVSEVRLSSAIVVKGAYICGAIAFTAATRFL